MVMVCKVMIIVGKMMIESVENNGKDIQRDENCVHYVDIYVQSDNNM
jgi:hypothetical protein